MLWTVANEAPNPFQMSDMARIVKDLAGVCSHGCLQSSPDVRTSTTEVICNIVAKDVSMLRYDDDKLGDQPDLDVSNSNSSIPARSSNDGSLSFSTTNVSSNDIHAHSTAHQNAWQSPPSTNEGDPSPGNANAALGGIIGKKRRYFN
ncbi:hypothetical protein M758_UG313800 [Ceratodon purpureus]|nr:hypothetical protein M758_UG313800 [Ceratodon purpureus]